jgi:hypothetical protein
MNYLKRILWIALFTCMFSYLGNAQAMRNVTLGLKTGAGFTLAVPSERFSLFENFESVGTDIYDKNYEAVFKNIGLKYTLMISYDLSENFQLTFEPGFMNYNYKYYNEYDWTGSQEYSVRYDFKHSIRYIDLPLGVKYLFSGEKITPFIHVGVFYGLRENSTKYVATTETGSFGEFEFEKEALGTDSAVIMSMPGAFGGLGLTYNFKHSKIGVEAGFRYGFNTVTNKSYRYESNTLSGKYYDIPDDIRLMNMSISVFYSVSLKCVKKYPLPQYRDF